MAKYQTKSVLNSEPFTTRQDAFNWLLTNGHKVAKSTFYAACNAGSPSVNADGSLDRNSILRYAQSLDKSTSANSDYRHRKQVFFTESNYPIFLIIVDKLDIWSLRSKWTFV